jgi:hypothetical protein
MATILASATPAAAARVEWGPVFAGALIAAALGTIFIAFGGAVGLSLTSPWPNSGITLWSSLVFVGYWSVMVQILTFAAGGYLAARLRSGVSARGEHNRFDDGAHGLLMWAIGIIMMALLAAFGSTVAAGNASRIAAGGAAGAGAAMGGPSTSATAAINPSETATALLLRPVPGATPAADAVRGDDATLRTDLARVFAGVIRNRELTARDRDYLAGIVSTRTGASEADARQRVTDAVNEARDLEIRARDAADKARRASVIAGFTIAVGMLLGLAAACVAAVFGGTQRDEEAEVAIFGHRIW